MKVDKKLIINKLVKKKLQKFIKKKSHPKLIKFLVLNIFYNYLIKVLNL